MKKEDKIKIYNKVFKFIFIVLLVSFLTLYISNETGYYEYERKQVILTQEKIKEFEEDVKNGENLDLEKYLEGTKKNYNNNTSKMGLFLSNKIGVYVKKGIESAFDFLNDVVNE